MYQNKLKLSKLFLILLLSIFAITLYACDKDENDGDSLLYCIEDELYETDYNIHKMVKNANTYINKLDTIVPVTCYIKKSKKSELRKIVDELNSEK